MEPPGASNSNLEGDGTIIELQSLVSPPSGPTDAPEDLVIVSPSSRSSYSARPPASATQTVVASPPFSNDGINNGLQRIALSLQQGEAAIRGYFLSNSGGRAPNAAHTPAAAAAAAAAANKKSTPESDEKRKKMILLLMSTLFVALLGAILAKSTAVGAELEVEAGEQQPAFHQHANTAAAAPDGKPIHRINVQGYQPTTMVNVSDFVLPGTEGAPPLSGARGRPYYPILNHFQHRDPSGPYAEKWGYFDFEDPDPKWDGKMRPNAANFGDVPNRDVSNSDFPTNAWQKDNAYMKAFLEQAKLLVNRSMEGVYAEYGVGIPPDVSVTLTEEQMANREQFFAWTLKDTINSPNKGGSWSTKKSFDGIARRIIHHIMTGDSFKLTLGGHSAAAGHGAGFNQSYIIEAGHVLEPVFAHLGVEFRSYNFAQGGMGTTQQALAGMDLRNKETDWIMWDSRMTERPPELANFFLRQAIVSGNRSPVLMGDGINVNDFHEVAGADIAAQALGWVPVTVSDEQVKEVPWAAQWLQCARGATTDCKAHEYTAGCWVEREDFTPEVGNAPGSIAGGAAAWHPGNRIHKRRGRMIALIVLKSLAYALEKWETLGAESGYPIAEEHWHVTDYYKDIRDKVVRVPGCYGNNWKIGQARHLEEIEDDDDIAAGTDGRSLEGEDYWPSRLCDIPLQGRTLWGPRDNPMESSLLTIMRPNDKGDIDPGIKNAAYMKPPCYQPPDRAAPWTVAPAGEPFAPLIGAARRLDGEEVKKKGGTLRGLGNVSVSRDRAGVHFSANIKNTTRTLAEDEAAATATPDKNGIIPGYGINVKWGRTGICDGSSHSWCNKDCDNGCLMSGAQDNRGMVCFNGLSGWVVFDIPNVKYGFIGARMEPWHNTDETPITQSWTEVNNGGNGNYGLKGRERRLHEEYQEQHMREGVERMEQEIEEDIQHEDDPGRRLGGGQSCGLVGDYVFEWAINGKIVTWTKTQFCEHFTRLNYNLDVVKFMDDESKTGNFELAMRISSPGAEAMCLTHMYWA